MVMKIEKKIVSYSVVNTHDTVPTPTAEPHSSVQQMHESVARPETLDRKSVV